jgi:DNA-binding transcriptional ArsR family regulator
LRLRSGARRNEAAFDALGNPVRRRIIVILARRQQAVGELARQLPVSRPAVSQHLRRLEQAGLVSARADGNRHVYQLEARGFDEARGWLDGFWNDALARFAMAAEHTRDAAAGKRRA